MMTKDLKKEMYGNVLMIKKTISNLKMRSEATAIKEYWPRLSRVQSANLSSFFIKTIQNKGMAMNIALTDSYETLIFDNLSSSLIPSDRIC